MGRDDIATAYIGQIAAGADGSPEDGASNLSMLNWHQNRRLKRATITSANAAAHCEAMQADHQSKQASYRSNWRRQWPASSLGTMLRRSIDARPRIDRRAAAAEAKCNRGPPRSTRKCRRIEREAMDMQLQDKLLTYKREMGLLGTGDGAQQALPAEGESGANTHRAVINEGSSNN